MAPRADDPTHPDTEAPTTWQGRPGGNEDLTIVDFGPSEPTAIAPVSFDTPPTHDEIAAEAYAIYESRGAGHGRDEDDWHEAERRIRDRKGRGQSA